MKIIFATLLCLCALNGHSQDLYVNKLKMLMQQQKATGGGGGGNNIAFVQNGGTGGGNTATMTFNFSGANVTSGNSVIACVNVNGGSGMLVAQLTKSAGTATIGTIALDIFTNGPANDLGIYRVPITGTGTITLTYTPAGGSHFMMMGCAEFSGFNASPVGPTIVNFGTGTSQSSGALTTSTAGIIIYNATELAAGDFTRTLSDTVIFKIDTGGSTYTGCSQYKLQTTSPNTLTDTTGTDSSGWNVIAIQYKSS